MFGVSIGMAGGKAIYYPCQKHGGHWDFSDLEGYITPKTRMLCLCNPHNPLGKLYSVAELRKILDIANAHGLYILNDEVWSDIIYSEVPFHSLMEFPKEDTQHVMTVYGFSKGFSMAGIRGGYLICPEKAIFDRAFDVSGVGVTVGGVPCLTQVAMKAAFEKGFPWVDAFVAHLQTCRDMAYDRLNAMPGIHADQAGGDIRHLLRYAGDGRQQRRLRALYSGAQPRVPCARQQAVVRAGRGGACPTVLRNQPRHFAGRA